MSQISDKQWKDSEGLKTENFTERAIVDSKKAEFNPNSLMELSMKRKIRIKEKYNKITRPTKDIKRFSIESKGKNLLKMDFGDDNVDFSINFDEIDDMFSKHYESKKETSKRKREESVVESEIPEPKNQRISIEFDENIILTERLKANSEDTTHFPTKVIPKEKYSDLFSRFSNNFKKILNEEEK
eukprot:gene9969-2288_t